MSLRHYHQKRNFQLTPEPYGKAAKKSSNLLYLIQKHAASHLHYDLRLELGGTLKSWAVPKGPSLDPKIKRLAMHVEDHPIDYGSFEGIIPAGQYGGGTVMLWDTGTWECENDNPASAYQKGDLTFNLKGKKLRGRWKLIRMKNDPKAWLLMKLSDRYAKPDEDYKITDKKPNSVTTGRSLDSITKNTPAVLKKKNSIDPKSMIFNLKSYRHSPMPATIHPELATLVDKPPPGKNWLHELKFDGYRILTFIANKKINIFTRNQNDWTAYFSQLVESLKKFKLRNAIFDGELVALDADQHSNFQLLQNSIHEANTENLVYYCFDLIYFNGKDLTNMPLLNRKSLLQKLIPTNQQTIRYSDHIIGQGLSFYKKACRLHLEGIVSKEINSHYSQKRSLDWLKSKCHRRQELIVVGYTAAKGSRHCFGSLLLAVYNKNKQLQYSGKVGTGFNEKSLQEVYDLLTTFRTEIRPEILGAPNFRDVIWVKPKIIVEIEFSEWTTSGSLRHPSF